MFPHNLVKTMGFHAKFVINFATNHSKDLLVALLSDPICLLEYQLCLPVSTLAEKEFLGFTIYRHSSGSTDQPFPDKTNQEQCLPSSIFTATAAFAGGKKAISLSPRLPCKRLIFPERRLLKVWEAELLICCVSLAVTQQDNWKNAALTANNNRPYTLLPALTPHIKTEVGFFTVCWPATVN